MLERLEADLRGEPAISLVMKALDLRGVPAISLVVEALNLHGGPAVSLVMEVPGLRTGAAISLVMEVPDLRTAAAISLVVQAPDLRTRRAIWLQTMEPGLGAKVKALPGAAVVGLPTELGTRAGTRRLDLRTETILPEAGHLARLAPASASAVLYSPPTPFGLGSNPSAKHWASKSPAPTAPQPASAARTQNP